MEEYKRDWFYIQMMLQLLSHNSLFTPLKALNPLIEQYISESHFLKSPFKFISFGDIVSIYT